MLLTLALSGLIIGQATFDLDKTEQSILQQRKSLARGRVLFKSTLETLTDGAQTRSYQIWFDKERIRVDRTTEIGPGVTFRQIGCHHCERQDYFVWFDESPAKAGGIAIQVGPMKGPGGSTRPTWRVMVDPKKIGLVATTVFALAEYESTTVVARGDRKRLRTAAEGEEPKRIWLVTYELDNEIQTKVNYWISEASGYNVVKMTVDSNQWGTIGKSTLECDYKLWGKTWFPRTTWYREERSGKLVESERVEIQEADFSQPIPPSVFSLSGMDLPKGSRMIDGGYLSEWDGKGIGKTEPKPMPDRAPDEPVRSTWLWVGAGCLALVGLGAFCLYFVRREK